MAIDKIVAEDCTGCGICINSCPTDVIRMDSETNKAIIAYPEDCMVCKWCEKDCPEDCVTVLYDAREIMASWE